MQHSKARFAIVGGGKMGSAIMAGLIASEEPAARQLTSRDFVVVNPGAQRREYLHKTYGVTCVEDVAHIEACEVVVLAVKPQMLMPLLERMASLPAFSGGSPRPLFISVAAGVTTTSIKSRLGAGARVVRVMPNLPLVIGEGASGVCATAASADDVAAVQALFQCLGTAVVVDEAQMDAVCALSGSGPAYVARMVEALVEAACTQGLTRELARALAVQTVAGTAQMLAQGTVSATELREAVSSPGGTTLAALEAMHEAGFEASLAAGIDAACRRSKELAKGA